MKKNIIVLLLLFICQAIFGQQYILFEQLENQFSIKKYTLSTKKMYGIDAEIEMYNIWHKREASYKKDNFILISILPDKHSGEKWKEIPALAVDGKIISIHKVEGNKNFNQIQILKKENDTFFVSKFCLIEKFIVTDLPTNIHISAKNVINLGQNTTIYQEIRKFTAVSSFSENPMENNPSFMEDYLKSIYLSKIENKNGEELYHFWTFDDWSKGEKFYYSHKKEKEAEDYDYHRGIDRFVYIKEKGIVAGSYDFYFDEIPLGFKRVVRSDMMWAKELFPEKQ